MLRFGEWIGEPVTPLFESWLLSGMEDRMHASFFEQIGQRAPRPYHVVVNGWYFYSLNLIWPEAHPPQPSAACSGALRDTHGTSRGSFRRPFATAFPIVERTWREDLQPRYRASVADAEARVETLPVAELPALIDELAELAGEYFAWIAALSRRRIQDGDEPRPVLPAPPASAPWAAATSLW